MIGLGAVSPNPAFTTMTTTLGLAGIVGNVYSTLLLIWFGSISFLLVFFFWQRISHRVGSDAGSTFTAHVRDERHLWYHGRRRTRPHEWHLLSRNASAGLSDGNDSTETFLCHVFHFLVPLDRLWRHRQRSCPRLTYSADFLSPSGCWTCSADRRIHRNTIIFTAYQVSIHKKREETWLTYRHVSLSLTAVALLGGYAAAASAGYSEIHQMVYLASSMCCVGALGGLSSQKTARLGNALGMLGVSGGIAATLGSLSPSADVLVQMGVCMGVGESSRPATAGGSLPQSRRIGRRAYVSRHLRRRLPEFCDRSICQRHQDGAVSWHLHRWRHVQWVVDCLREASRTLEFGAAFVARPPRHQLGVARWQRGRFGRLHGRSIVQCRNVGSGCHGRSVHRHGNDSHIRHRRSDII